MTDAEGQAGLNLPQYDFEIRRDGDKRVIFDPIRRKFVRLTPEEWVRQHFLQYLVRACGYPSSLIAVEMGFRFQHMPRRADIVVHDRSGSPYLMVECKSPGAGVGQSSFDQISRYNRVVGARYLAVTNGMAHYCWRIDRETGTYDFLDGIPDFQIDENL